MTFKANDKKVIVIYHKNCADGFGAAWAARDALKHLEPGAEYYAATHGDPPPDVKGKIVVMVDFAYKLPVLATMALHADGILILDHHKSASDEIVVDNDLCNVIRVGAWAKIPMRKNVTTDNWGHFLTCVAMDKSEGANTATVYACFDMEKSGAGVTWDFFHPYQGRPALINHIEDRDLWRFALPGTREIQAALFSYPYDFEVWDELMYGGASIQRLENDGVAIERKHHKDVKELSAATVRMKKIAGWLVPVCNLPYTMSSDVGHLLATQFAFAACYWDTPDGRVFSLRSSENSDIDVSSIAKMYGGGGHKNAAGFRVSMQDAVLWELTDKCDNTFLASGKQV